MQVCIYKYLLLYMYIVVIITDKYSQVHWHWIKTATLITATTQKRQTERCYIYCLQGTCLLTRSSWRG